MVLYDQGQSSNEVQVVGVDSRNTKEAETVLQNSIQEGSARFISTLWKEKLDDIKRELYNCSTDYKGIEVSRTAEGLEKCLPQIHGLVSAVQKKIIPVDKAGMTKFYMEGKGHGILKTVEEKISVLF